MRFSRTTEIHVLQAINNVLKERHEIESNYKNLALKFRDMQEEESLRRAKVCSVCEIPLPLSRFSNDRSVSVRWSTQKATGRATGQRRGALPGKSETTAPDRTRHVAPGGMPTEATLLGAVTGELSAQGRRTELFAAFTGEAEDYGKSGGISVVVLWSIIGIFRQTWRVLQIIWSEESWICGKRFTSSRIS